MTEKRNLEKPERKEVQAQMHQIGSFRLHVTHS